MQITRQLCIIFGDRQPSGKYVITVGGFTLRILSAAGVVYAMTWELGNMWFAVTNRNMGYDMAVFDMEGIRWLLGMVPLMAIGAALGIILFLLALYALCEGGSRLGKIVIFECKNEKYNTPDEDKEG